ncbi:larval cuticle protein A2B [Manduca sexta]|uniref:Cuticle protein n=1 Tax=Manduca sexta TaxID=7130 RepID=A0A922CRZ7_MANSE|nr:larval cuticle protein A2B [Manduca sexta]KAG6456093.1 hypothetical protein O3G_MSEX009562 [Manduca sexta]KAG6456094.1 hypothetical protein O3G_MSEX009562 [Manduca sexta]
MFRASILVCVVPSVLSIIVKDPLPSPSDYKYSYNIDDPTTGDSKSQHEVRLGDTVSGAYSVVDPDGTKRIVEYTADAKHGFQATVREEPPEQPVVTTTPAPGQYNYNKYYANNNPRSAYHPVPIAHNEISSIPYYIKANQLTEDQVLYFTPANEIRPEKSPFVPGQYFLPSTK